MRLVYIAILIATASPAFAQDNTLTPKEIANGWLLLFDGETDYGWQGEGTVKDGMLTIKGDGTQKAFAQQLGRFQEFGLTFDYKVEGPAAASGPKTPTAVQASLTLLQNMKATQVIHFEGPQNPKNRDWLSASVISKAGYAQASMRDGSLVHVIGALGRSPNDPKSGSWESAMPVGIENTQLKWTIPERSTLHLKNVKINPLALKPLFNGKDLTGWKEFPGKKSKFTVNAQGEINIKDGPGDLQTEGKYENFILQLECISNGKHLNSGVFFRCRPNEYQNGYEVQIRNQFTKEPTQEYTLEEYDPQSHKLIGKTKVKSTAFDYGTGAIYRRQPARKEVSKDGEWFTLTVLAHKNHYMTWVNGIQVADFVDNRPPNDNARNGYRQEAGHISLQGHDPTTDLSFRNIRIAEIK